MPRVLIPSDNRDYVIHLVTGYSRLGWEAVVGTWNLGLSACDFDLIHLQWPEELTQWNAPQPGEIETIVASLKAWRKKVKVLATVHNLYPHRYEGNAVFRCLYEQLYSCCDVIHHFSNASRREIVEYYPCLASLKHFVTSPFNYDRLLPAKRIPRAESRLRYGLAENDFSVLVFGSIREWREVRLLREAWAQVKLPHKRLLTTARYMEPLPPLKRRWRQWRWHRWLRQGNVVNISGYLPDANVYQVFDAADVAILPRIGAISSGLPNLAMTFGTPMIVPRQGAFPEYLTGSRNLLYEPRDAASLAGAIESAATLDREAVGLENRRIADRWGWDKIVIGCLQASGFESGLTTANCARMPAELH